jgi:hypothetical protein
LTPIRSISIQCLCWLNGLPVAWIHGQHDWLFCSIIRCHWSQHYIGRDGWLVNFICTEYYANSKLASSNHVGIRIAYHVGRKKQIILENNTLMANKNILFYWLKTLRVGNRWKQNSPRTLSRESSEHIFKSKKID